MEQEQLHISDDQCKFSVLQVLTPEGQEQVKEYLAKRAQKEEEELRKAKAYRKEHPHDPNPPPLTLTRETS